MKSIHADLLSHLNSNKEFLIADLLSITLASGALHRYTNFDRDVGAFTSGDVRFKRSRVTWKTGVEVSQLDLSLYALPTSLLNGQPFLSGVRAGFLDGAQVLLQRAYLTVSPQAVVSIIGAPISWFGGRVAGETETTRSAVHLVVKSDLELLTNPFPRNVYQPSCVHTLYDFGCGLDRNNFSYGTTVSAATLNWISTPLGDTFAPSTWNLGKVSFTSGVNNGQSYTIKWYASGAIVLFKLMSQVPAPGDSVVLSLGCDLQKTTCQSKFNNLARFRGYPYIPVPETVIPT